jgi:L-aspartate oxidase
MKNYDYIVVGSGIAGLNFAINAAKKGKVLIVTKKKIIESTTNYAQGGIAGVMDQLDNFDKHIKDTLNAGAYHNNKKAVEYMVKNAPFQITKLLNFGVPFAKKDNKLLLAKEGGHSERRIAYVGDHTGNAIEKTLIRNVKNNKNIDIWENSFAIDLLVKNNVCYGLKVLKNQKVDSVYAGAVVLATGGLGQIYKFTTNPKISTGDGVAMAARAGAKLEDLEFIQFHPTALTIKNKKRFLLSEALRGEGALLINSKGERFMKKYDKRKELAPRDIVARAIYNELKNGRVFLDISHKDATYLKKRFPTIYEEVKKKGMDITKEPIPVSPAAHYSCGGIKVNLKGQTSIRNLYAFGETACTGVHGANRLASNSLLEAIVFSSNVPKININKKFSSFNDKNTKSRNIEVNSNILKNIKNSMWQNVGIIREKKNLLKTYNELIKLKKTFILNKFTVKNLETRNILDCAIEITNAALKRKKSLGCHYVVIG